MRLESLPGSILDQKYRIDRQLGRGAMGAVFQATHLGTTRSVALKVIVPGLAANVEFAQRFKREAEASGRLRHINVVNVTDFGVTHAQGGELAYLVMEYLDGETLSAYLKNEPRPSFNFIVDVIEQTAMALDAAHAAGIVHRDLKPSNIWIQPNHRGGFNVKVLDFGIAKVGGTAEVPRQVVEQNQETVVMPNSGEMPTLHMMTTPSSLRTTIGTLLGTPSYMAPEQCQTLEVDARADIYSLAVIAYEMLCSRLPFQADDLQQLIQMQIGTRPQSPHDRDPSVPQALSDIVMSGLDKDPAQRPPSAGAFAARLRAVAEGEIGLLRKAKDAAHTHINCFLPILFVCIAAIIVCMIPVQMLARLLYEAKVAPAIVLSPAMSLVEVGLLIFAFQFYKAACSMALQRAAETGQFRPMLGSTLSAMLRAVPAFLGTQLRSALDLRPSSFRDNLLWPVIWAREGLSGKAAIDRSRALCRSLRGAAAGLMVRQYGPPMLALLGFPASLSITGGAVLPVVAKEAVSGSSQGWFFLLYPLMFGVMLLNYGASFTFLYWTALRGRGEGGEVALPAAARDDSRDRSASVRPSTLVWIGIPTLLLAIVVWGATAKDQGEALDAALNEGRTADVLKMMNAGLAVDHRDRGGATPLCQAALRGPLSLATALLDRGADPNARNRSGATPLMLAVGHGQEQIARLLLDRGAKPDLANSEGRTPLMIAAMGGRTALVQLLLEHGADRARADSRHKTALDYAREQGHDDIARLLR